MMDYADQKNRRYTEKIRALVLSLPPFCGEFFRSLENRTSVMTRYAYATDLKLFFDYLIAELSLASSVQELTLKHLDALDAAQIEIYLEYIGLYTKHQQERRNCERAKGRKLSSLRVLFKYFFKKEKLTRNVAALVDLPKIHEKPIIRLEPDEVARFLDTIEKPDAFTDTQRKFQEKMRIRDTAIMTLFLGTGIRISELVGLNCGDINFSLNAFRITRKGGDEAILYFGDEVRAALLLYLREREAVKPLEGHEEALFLSLQRRRITVRAIENLVQKYAQTGVTLKKISPHKLRSTFATMLYQETGDIYLVADVLGHKDVNTTKRHYAALSDDLRRLAAKKIRLREDD